MSKILGILISLHHLFSQYIFFLFVVVSGFLLIYPLMRKPKKRKFTEEQERLIVKGTVFVNLFVYLAAASLVELAYLSSLYFSGETSGGEHPSLKVIFVRHFSFWE